MIKNIIYIIGGFLLLPNLGYSQVQPFSRKDSANYENLHKKYKTASENEKFRNAAKMLNDIAYLYWDHNQYKKAISFYEKSISYNKKVENENGIAMISNNLGMLYSDIGDFKTSLNYFQKTLANRRAKTNKVGLIATLINLSVVSNNLKKFDASTTYLEEALSIAREINDVDQMRSCYGMLAETYQKSGDIEKSLYYYEFYKSFHELTQKEKIANIEDALTSIQNKKEVLESERLFISNQLVSKKEEISTLAKEMNRVDTTLVALQKKLDLNDLSLKAAQQEKTILALKAENETKMLAAEHRKVITTYLIAALIIGFLIILIGYFLYSQKKIKNQNQILIERNDEILDMNQKLENSNEVKDTLFSVIAHDLRTPLAQLEMTFDMLNEDMLNEEEKTLMFQELQTGVKSSNLLLNNLLAWARNQKSLQSISLKSFELNRAVEESIDVLKSLSNAKEIQLTQNYTFDGLINADEDMIKTIVRNLTSNAIKFTPKKGHITIESFKEENFACIKVQDTGVGMTNDQTEHLFDKDFFSTTNGTDSEKGTGLGLKLCKQFIDLMKGSIHIESVIDQGTVFTVRLPLNS